MYIFNIIIGSDNCVMLYKRRKIKILMWCFIQEALKLIMQLSKEKPT